MMLNPIEEIISYGVFTRSSKRPANFQQMYLMLDVCWIV